MTPHIRDVNIWSENASWNWLNKLFFNTYYVPDNVLVILYSFFWLIILSYSLSLMKHFPRTKNCYLCVMEEKNSSERWSNSPKTTQRSQSSLTQSLTFSTPPGGTLNQCLYRPSIPSPWTLCFSHNHREQNALLPLSFCKCCSLHWHTPCPSHSFHSSQCITFQGKPFQIGWVPSLGLPIKYQLIPLFFHDQTTFLRDRDFPTLQPIPGFMQSWDLVHVNCMTEGGMDGRLHQAQEDKHFKLHNGPLGPGS